MPDVSTFIITYNQRDTIRQAIESAVSQDFAGSHEIVVADDGSSDGTREEVISLAQSHPAAIKPLLAERNLGFQHNAKSALEACNGDHIAVLEGDDFWCCGEKLKLQVAALEAHSEVDLVFSRAIILHPDDTEELGWDYGGKERVVFTRELIERGGTLVPTGSVLVRASAWRNLPNWLWSAPVLDTFLLLLAAQRKGALYLPVATTTYRAQHTGSWTAALKHSAERQIALSSQMLTTLSNAEQDIRLSRSEWGALAAGANHTVGRQAIRDREFIKALAHYRRLPLPYLLNLLRRRSARFSRSGMRTG